LATCCPSEESCRAPGAQSLRQSSTAKFYKWLQLSCHPSWSLGLSALFFLLRLGLVLFGVPLLVRLVDVVAVGVQVFVDAIFVSLKDGGFFIGAAAVDRFVARQNEIVFDPGFIGFAEVRDDLAIGVVSDL